MNCIKGFLFVLLCLFVLGRFLVKVRLSNRSMIFTDHANSGKGDTCDFIARLFFEFDVTPTSLSFCPDGDTKVYV